MCGLVAAFGATTSLTNAVRSALDRMRARGPDGEGNWQEDGVVLAHRRLAIIDLDTRAAQPMHSACGRYVIVFNGEIYNFRELRKKLELEGATFATNSDTEVILTLFAREHEAMLRRLHGMFAFVIWDRVAHRAFAARDPYGIKPLYVGRTSNGVILASQVKALLATGLISHAPDLEGQTGFWLMGSVPEPHTWYRDIQSLKAGHYAWIENGAVSSSACWYDIGDAWRNAPAKSLPDDELLACVSEALHETVARHLVADVPVGVFLSGGIDSGALAGLMVEAGARNLQGVTIAYDEFAGSHEDEAPVATTIARHYGITHHVRRVSREEFLSDLPRILASMDQPSIDGVNTWYASKAVSELGLKVVVSGIGGDELFQGYESFRQLPKLSARWRALSALPGALPLARLAGKFQAHRTRNSRWRHAADWSLSLEGMWWLRRGLFAPDDLHELMGATPPNTHDFDPKQRVLTMAGALPTDPRLALGQIESTTYLRNQLLRDSDWASMDHSVELRTPLVDAHLLTQLQPLLSNFARFPNKRLLAMAPEKPLPESIILRKKSGFAIPVSRWLAEAGIARNDVSRSWAQYVAATVSCLEASAA